jgi:uncharacterized membrane protein YqgA involved in biofilm formation
MQGTLINTGAVILGSIFGLLIHSRLPKKIVTITFQAIGLFTLVLGFEMTTRSNNFLIMIFSIVIGSIIGEIVDLEKRMNNLSGFLNKKFKLREEGFTNGFITSTLLFCVGSMAILGAIEEGLGGKPNLLLAKSILDGFTSLALASSLGIGVLFSAIPLLVYQGGITLFAGYLQTYLTERIITELTAVGGLLLIGLGISLLDIKKLNIVNMLPSLLVVIILAYSFA